MKENYPPFRNGYATSHIAPFCTSIRAMWLVFKNSSISFRKEPHRFFRHVFGPGEWMKIIHFRRSIAWRCPLSLSPAWDSSTRKRGILLKSIHFFQKGATTFSGPFWRRRMNGSNPLPRNFMETSTPVQLRLRIRRKLLVSQNWSVPQKRSHSVWARENEWKQSAF